jgi:glutathionylspermidine synthase
MQRITRAPRPDWQARVEEYGLTFHTIDGALYWDESAYYRFTLAQVDEIEDATQALHDLCLATVDDVVTRGAYERFEIPEAYLPGVEASWRRGEEAVYGRFDFAYDGVHPPKMLEYNADTPTALLEASVIQWFWLQETCPDADQYNSIHERLHERMSALRAEIPGDPTFYFASIPEHAEDFMTTNYLRDVAMQAGFTTDYLTVPEIGWDEDRRAFIDMDLHAIDLIFKLYPWEWMVREAYGPCLRQAATRWIEPMWKMLLSNKALLPLLWERYPDHPNLLPASWAPLPGPCVRKPIFSREGANIAILRDGAPVQSTGGPYTDCPCIYQTYHPLPCFDGHYPVVGSWVVGDTACGMGLREDRSPITQDTSRFVPHLFLE